MRGRSPRRLIEILEGLNPTVVGNDIVRYAGLLAKSIKDHRRSVSHRDLEEMAMIAMLRGLKNTAQVLREGKNKLQGMEFLEKTRGHRYW